MAKLEDFEPVINDVCKVPKIFKKQLFDYIIKNEKMDSKTEEIPKQTFINFWKREFEDESVKRRTFKIIA